MTPDYMPFHSKGVYANFETHKNYLGKILYVRIKIIQIIWFLIPPLFSTTTKFQSCASEGIGKSKIMVEHRITKRRTNNLRAYLSSWKPCSLVSSMLLSYPLNDTIPRDITTAMLAWD